MIYQYFLPFTDKRVVRRKTKSQLSGKIRAGKKLDGSADEKRSSSTEGRKKSVSKKIDLRARYWAFLFDNLQRAVDEIYQTCEVDESIVECKVILTALDGVLYRLSQKKQNLLTLFCRCLEKSLSIIELH